MAYFVTAIALCRRPVGNFTGGQHSVWLRDASPWRPIWRAGRIRQPTFQSGLPMLIDCAAYIDGVRQTPMDIDGPALPLLHRNRRAPSFAVALFEPPPSLLSKMQEEFNLHELAIEDTNRGSQRPKLEEYGSTLFVVLHTVDDMATSSSTANCTSTAVSILLSRCGTVPRPAFVACARSWNVNPRSWRSGRAPRCMVLLTPSLTACFRGGCSKTD